MSHCAGARNGKLRRAAIYVLTAYAVALAVILLSPLSYSSIVHALGDLARDGLSLGWVRDGMVEMGANIALFMPLGLLLTLSTARPWVGAAWGLVVSACAELAQVLIPGRVTSLRDLFANTLGAAIGALVGWLITRRRQTVAAN